MCWNETTPFRRAQRSSAVGHEVVRSTAALAKRFRAFPYTTRPPSGQAGTVVGRQSVSPDDTRSSGRLPCAQSFSERFRIRHAWRPATSVHVRWRQGEDRPGGRSVAVVRRGDCTSRSAKLEDFSAGTDRGHRPPYSMESIPFLGRFLARSKSGPTGTAKIPQLRPGSLYVVGCGISAADMFG